MDWYRKFQNPPAINRIKPFWFWNGDMDKKTIDFQLKEMANKGLGGAFICARQGLSIPYLSKEWFERIAYASERATQYGLEVWLYDEYPYPSGMAGGEVLLKHPEAEHLILEHKSFIQEEGEFEINIGWSEVLYAKAFQIIEDKTYFNRSIDLNSMIGNLQTEEIFQTTGLTEYNHKRFFTYSPEHIINGKLPAGKWKIEIYTQKPLGDFKYYGRFFDPCADDAVRTFLKLTHEKYKAYMGNQFGNKIKGMFSDEVGLLSSIPWSKRLPEYFKKVKGYDILEHLPALHDSAYPNAYVIRYDLYDAMHNLFVKSYHEQVAGWCKNNHLEYATEVPSMRMTTQRNSTIVGGDTAHEKLGKSLEWIYDTYIPNYRSNAKSVSSLTRQLGQQYAMIESFHSVGWSMTLQDAKWMFDRLAASGINFYNVHAFYYTIDSITKHDAPPSQFLQNPYWKHYRTLADYAARLSVWVSNTEAEITVAVLDPVASLWALLGNPFSGFTYSGEDKEEKLRCEKVREQWVKICKELLFSQIDYEHLDSEMLEQAQIKEGKIRIGRASYSTLIIPPTPYLEKAAYQKIKEFAEYGGNVLCLGEIPQLLIDEEGKEIDWSDFGWNENERKHFINDINNKEWIAWCDQMAGRSISISLSQEMSHHLISSIRKDEKNIYVFLANQGQKAILLSLLPRNKKYRTISELLLESGEKKVTDLSGKEITLRPYESRILCWSKEEKTDRTETSTEKRHACRKQIVVSTKGELPISIEGQNIFRIEEFQISKNRKSWNSVIAQTFVEQCASQPLLEGRDYRYQSEFGIPKSILTNYPMEVWYRTEFEIAKLPEQISLLMDKDAVKSTYIIWVNGNQLEKEKFQTIFVNDQNNQICNIGKFVKKGKNQLEIKVLITKDSDGIRDPLYLYGDFGVEKEENTFVITERRKKSPFRLDYIEGYPYYSGTFHFNTTLELDEIPEKFELLLDVQERCHDCLEILINGESLGTKTFSPYVWNGEGIILKKGVNEVEIRRTNTLAGMLDGTYFDDENHCLKRILESESEA